MVFSWRDPTIAGIQDSLRISEPLLVAAAAYPCVAFSAGSAATKLGSTGARIHTIAVLTAFGTAAPTISDGTTTITIPTGWTGSIELNAESQGDGWTVTIGSATAGTLYITGEWPL